MPCTNSLLRIPSSSSRCCRWCSGQRALSLKSSTPMLNAVPLRPIQSWSSWRVVPGQDSDGRIEADASPGSGLRKRDTRLRQAKRVGIGYQKIGQMLSGCPHDPDGTWPCKAAARGDREGG